MSSFETSATLKNGNEIPVRVRIQSSMAACFDMCDETDIEISIEFTSGREVPAKVLVQLKATERDSLIQQAYTHLEA